MAIPGVSTRLNISSLPFFAFIVIFSFMFTSLVSWGTALTLPISSPSQSMHILLASVVLPEFGGPYNPSLKFCFGPHSRKLFRNFLILLSINPPSFMCLIDWCYYI